MANLHGIQRYKERIENKFSYLQKQYGARILPTDDDKLLVYKLKKSFVRFVLDRQQVFVDIGPDSHEWFDLGLVILTKDPMSDFKYVCLDDQNCDRVIDDLSYSLAKHGKKLLEGDFSIRDAYSQTGKRRWKEIEEKHKKR